MATVAEKVKSQGYWRIRVWPGKYSQHLIENISEIYPMVQRLSVDIRGWSFPQIDPNTQPIIQDSYIAQEIDWESHVETWRFYQSGQFAYLGGFWVDWPSSYGNPFTAGSVVLIEHAVARHLEALEFAARHSAAINSSGGLALEIGAYNLKGRRLASTSPLTNMFLQARTSASIEQVVLKKHFSNEQLLADPAQIALGWARELFRRFNWDPEAGQLEDIRGQFGRMS